MGNIVVFLIAGALAALAAFYAAKRGGPADYIPPRPHTYSASIIDACLGSKRPNCPHE